jgi:NTE family protein
LPYERVEALAVRPSEDIGGLAREHHERGKLRGDPLVTKRFFSLLGIGADREADLASYLLFDGPFCRKLIEMGRADAHARRDDLTRFFGAVGDDGERPHDASADRSSISMPVGE